MKKVTVDSYFVGTEPSFKQNPNLSLSSALSWYANQLCASDSKKYALQYASKHKKEIVGKLNRVEEGKFLNLGFVCRIIENGAVLNEKQLLFVENRFSELLKSSVSEVEILDTEKEEKSNLTQVRFNETTAIINEIDEYVDRFIKTLKIPNFSLYEYLVKNSIKSFLLSGVIDHYTPLLNEISLAIKKTDDQINESYSYYTRPQLNNYYNFINGIIEDCKRYVNNIKVERKPRKKKSVSLDKIISNLNYRKEEHSLKLKSVNPLDILHAKQLWVYNVKSKKFGVYVAVEGSTLGVKGTTIQGFDETLSVQKNIRKPEEFFSNLVEKNKNAMGKTFKGINAKELPLTGRINDEVVLVKIFK